MPCLLRIVELPQEVSEGRSPLTVIVSGGFAAGAGRFPLAENIPYAEERPWTALAPDTVTECNLTKVALPLW